MIAVDTSIAIAALSPGMTVTPTQQTRVKMGPRSPRTPCLRRTRR